MKIVIYGHEALHELVAAREALNHLITGYSERSKEDAIPDPLPTTFGEIHDKAVADTPPPPPTSRTQFREELAEKEAASVPAPPAPPADQAAPPAPQAAPSSDDTYDEQGCPWDERIHAGTKTKTEAGKWKRRRGIDDDTYRAVMQEITARGYVPGSAPAAQPEPQVPAVPDAATAGFGGNSNGQSSAIEWPDLVQAVMQAKVTDQITQSQVDKAVQQLGVEGGFNAMVTRPELYPQLMIELGL